MSGSAAINLRSPSSLWQGLLAMWPLLLDSGYLYYPITALHSGLHPVLEDIERVFYLTRLSSLATFSCLLRNIKGKKKSKKREEHFSRRQKVDE